MVGGYMGTSAYSDQILSFGKDQIWLEEAQKLEHPRDSAVAFAMPDHLYSECSEP